MSQKSFGTVFMDRWDKDEPLSKWWEIKNVVEKRELENIPREMHSEEEGLSDKRLSKNHSWRIVEISCLGVRNLKNNININIYIYIYIYIMREVNWREVLTWSCESIKESLNYYPDGGNVNFQCVNSLLTATFYFVMLNNLVLHIRTIFLCFTPCDDD